MADINFTGINTVLRQVVNNHSGDKEEPFDPNERKVVLSTKVHPDTKKEIEDIAAQENTSPAAIVRQGVEIRRLYPYSAYRKLVAHHEAISQFLSGLNDPPYISD